MKYEVPVCDIIEFDVEDVIATSLPVTPDEKGDIPGGSDIPAMPVGGSDNGLDANASN